MAWPLLSLVKRTPSATRRASAARRRACRRLVDAPHRFERLEPRLLLSDVQWTGNGDGTSWDDANNWEVDGAGTGVPQAGDDVTIDVVAPTTVVLDSGATSVAINSLTTNAAFTISSRTLTINGPATFDAGLTMSGGTINGTGNIAISNASFDWTFGTIGGTGTITVSGGMNLSGNSNKIVDGKEMILDSNTTWSAGVWQVRNGAVITNQATHTVDIQANLNLDDATTGGTETFNNFGTVQKSALTGDARLEPSFDNKSTGVVHAMVGTIEFDGNVVNAGGLTADLDAIVEFSVSGGVYDLDAGTTVTGAGEIRLVQGALNINTPLTFATGYAQSGGTLGGTENLEIAGPLTWTAGTIAGTRTITISGGLAASGSGTKIQSFATLSLDSNTTWSNGVWRLQDGAVIDNLATHTFDIQGNLRLDVPSAQTGEFNNFGTIQKSGGTGDSVFEPVFDNKGASVVHSMSGTIEFAGDVTSAGRFTADVGDAVEINAAGKMINLDAGTTVTGDGALVLTRGLFNVIAPLAFDADFRLTGGQVDAQAALTLNGLFTWTAGTVIGAGGIVASGGTTLSTTGTKILDGSTLSLDSDTDWVAGVWRVTGDGAVDNRATRTLDIQGNFSLDVPSGQTGSFDNFGTVMKTDGTGDSLLETTFDNKSSGVVHSMSGTIEFARSVTSSGRFTADDGDRVEINAAGFQIDLDAGTTVTGAG
ncbi:MAG: hypothetical protein CMJ18_26820, partial [Phycisphaeraceae bacterium]|nr:hypothetical protein [Phycisphaeraceae bacterium]